MAEIINEKRIAAFMPAYNVAEMTSWRTWSAHIRIARIDHWVKNVFVLPGIVAALTLDRLPLNWELVEKTVIGLLAVGLIASSNYVINEICDAPFDRFHPLKRNRPVPSGAVIIPLAYAQWLFWRTSGLVLFLSWKLSPWFGWDMRLSYASAVDNGVRLQSSARPD